MKVIISIAVLLLLFLVLQFWNPSVGNPPVTGKIKAPPEVVAILDRACGDCHSNETRLHWYDQIAPASWLVAADIRKARSRYNLSTWDSTKPADQQGELWEMINMVIDGKMPLESYAAFHHDARVTPAEIEVLKGYLKTLDHYKLGDTGLIAAADREFAGYAARFAGDSSGIDASAGSFSKASLVAADGVRYIDSFTNWQVISTTNRFDNHSIRVVYGNALVVKAIASGQVHSFPDGSAIVKAVWNSIEDTNGHIRPGTLNSIQIMIRDEKRFPETEGWGFAKFNGVGLKPYGAHAAFNTTCFNCHKLASDFGYVFNIPPTRELFDAGGLRVITSFADSRTMSTLYGNDAARFSALKKDAVAVPGAKYMLVTWGIAKNTYWYGSRINGALLSVEQVVISPDSQASYTVTKGPFPASGSRSRTALILGLRGSVIP